MSKISSFMGGGGYRRQRPMEDDDPAGGLANLSDCMLVLACGLMVALVIAWNIDINTTEVVMSEDSEEVSTLEDIDGDFEAGNTSYINMGRVYKDPETGKMYVIEDAE